MKELNSRANRGNGNGGSAYRNSSFWDSIEKKKKQQQKDKDEK